QTETGRRSREGTGLGLAISRNYVQIMGGELEVRSTLGEGTTFSFHVKMPFVDAANIEKEQRRVQALAPGQANFRILIADDKWENRALLHKMLASVGFVVKEVANGQEAVDAWESWHPDLIWLDIRMAVMDGYTAARTIRRREKE